MDVSSSRKISPFRPRARLLELLGEQLIDNARLAVFEMVKNAYDADANEVKVLLYHPDTKEGKISVHDDGTGMTLETLSDVWLEPGAGNRFEQKTAGIRSERFNRLPLGEKGVGRFAAHKLGNKICLWTQAADNPEYHVEINWAEQIKRRYMDETEVEIQESSGVHFGPKETGTHIEISALKSRWTRGDVRRLWNNVTSITAPFTTSDDFDVTLEVPGRTTWLKGLLAVGDIVGGAIWSYEFNFTPHGYTWNYEFSPPKAIRVDKQEQQEKLGKLPFPKSLAKAHYEHPNRTKNKIFPSTVPTDFCDGIGSVRGTLLVFDKDREILPLLTRPSQVVSYLDENGGIRVYRGDVRVYSYGEPGNDWLGLDSRRVNQPTRSISNNNVIGLVALDDAESLKLREKTSRDGFDDNTEYQRFRIIVLSAINHLEGLRSVDKNRMKRVLDRKAKASHISPHSAIKELRDYARKHNVNPQINRIVDKLEQRVSAMQDTLLRPGATQMHIAIVFHEVEVGIRALHSAIRRGEDVEQLERRSNALVELLDSFANFFRKTPEEQMRMSELVETVMHINADRFRRHSVSVSCQWKSPKARDFSVRAPKNILMGAISNVMDNSIYWLDQRWGEKSSTRARVLKIFGSDYFKEGPALVVADNGPGYMLAPEDILQPFVTLKPDGMGIGMYYARLVMEMLGGFVAFPEAADVGLGKRYSGAITAFVFADGRWLK